MAPKYVGANMSETLSSDPIDAEPEEGGIPTIVEDPNELEQFRAEFTTALRAELANMNRAHRLPSSMALATTFPGQNLGASSSDPPADSTADSTMQREEGSVGEFVDDPIDHEAPPSEFAENMILFA